MRLIGKLLNLSRLKQEQTAPPHPQKKPKTRIQLREELSQKIEFSEFVEYLYTVDEEEKAVGDNSPICICDHDLMAQLNKMQHLSREAVHRKGKMKSLTLLKWSFGNLVLELKREIKACTMDGSIYAHWVIWKIISISSEETGGKKGNIYFPVIVYNLS